MRILFMADLDPDPNAGAAGTELRTIAALQALGHEVDAVWAPQLGRRIAHGNLHYLFELPRAYRREMRRAAAAKTYDVFHVNQPHGYLAARTKPDGSVFVHRSHGVELRAERVLDPWRDRFGARRRLTSKVMGALLARHTRAIARNADGHIVSCTDDAEFLRGELGVERNRIAVIPQAAPDAFAQREALPITAARLRRVLHVSQFAFFKAPMIVAAAIDQLAAADDTLRFTWVCSRRHHDDVRRLLHTDRVELRDWMPAAQLIDVYDEHGIFLFASFFEGFGKVFLEAMSRGLCVVAARTGGAPDIIVDRANGRLVEPGDAGALASATQALVHDLPEATVMGTAAARTARAYTWERVARETADFYERLRAMRR